MKEDHERYGTPMPDDAKEIPVLEPRLVIYYTIWSLLHNDRRVGGMGSFLPIEHKATCWYSDRYGLNKNQDAFLHFYIPQQDKEFLEKQNN